MRILGLVFLLLFPSSLVAQDDFTFNVLEFSFSDPYQRNESVESAYGWSGLGNATFISPGGTALGDSYDNFLEFQADIIGEWTVEENGKTILFDLDRFELDADFIPDATIISPVNGGLLVSGQEFSVDIETTGNFNFLSAIGSLSTSLGEVQRITDDDPFVNTDLKVILNEGVDIASVNLQVDLQGFTNANFTNFRGDTADVGFTDHQFVFTESVNVTVRAVPEPATLLPLALCSLGVFSRRRRR